MSNLERLHGVVHGRFQPLHNGHIEYIRAALSRSRFLWIGLTNPDVGSLRFEAASPHRSVRSANPFRFYERLEMVYRAMDEVGADRSSYAVVPFPLHAPNLLAEYVPRGSTFFVTVYDNWGDEKVDRLSRTGVGPVEVLWRRTPDERVTSGTAIRAMLVSGEKEWRDVVPAAVASYIDAIGASQIVRRITEPA